MLAFAAYPLKTSKGENKEKGDRRKRNEEGKQMKKKNKRKLNGLLIAAALEEAVRLFVFYFFAL